MYDLSLILHDIRSVHNVGSIFRTADGAGVSKIYLTGYTPTPIDRFGREVAAFSKVSLGAEKTIPWEKRDIDELLEELRESKTQIVAVEQSSNSITYKEFTPTFPTAFIFGNEVEGIPDNVLQKADAIIDLPMKGEKESLNVGVAAGIVLYHFGS